MLGVLEQKVRRTIKEKGLLETTKWILTAGMNHCRHFPLKAEQWLADWAFDYWNGVDTRGTIDQEDLEFGDSASAVYSSRYVAVGPRLFHQMVGALRIPHKEFTFVDIGSGKGRALLMASAWPFRRILGVELSPKLHSVAVRNIQRFKRRGVSCRNIRSLWCDAARYPIPRTKLVLYLYNPFKEAVMRRLLDNIRASWERHPRDIYVLYRTPACNDLFLLSGFLNLIQTNAHFAIYHAPAFVGRRPASPSSSHDG